MPQYQLKRASLLSQVTTDNAKHSPLDSAFAYNTASYGSAVYFDASQGGVFNCTFYASHAEQVIYPHFYI